MTGRTRDVPGPEECCSRCGANWEAILDWREGVRAHEVENKRLVAEVEQAKLARNVSDARAAALKKTLHEAEQALTVAVGYASAVGSSSEMDRDGWGLHRGMGAVYGPRWFETLKAVRTALVAASAPEPPLPAAQPAPATDTSSDPRRGA